MYILLNSEPYANVENCRIYESYAILPRLVGVNIETRAGKDPSIQAIYRPIVYIAIRPGQVILNIPWKKDKVIMVSFMSRFPYISVWKDKLGLKVLK